MPGSIDTSPTRRKAGRTGCRNRLKVRPLCWRCAARPTVAASRARRSLARASVPPGKASWPARCSTKPGARTNVLCPFLFDGGDEVVPTALGPYTRYRLPDEYDGLYRHLTNQPEVVPTPLGPRRVLGDTRGLAKAARPALPAIPPSGPGAPDPGQLDSPFVVGPPIERVEQFFGRGRQLDEIRHALRERQPIQIVGETRMGKDIPAQSRARSRAQGSGSRANQRPGTRGLLTARTGPGHCREPGPAGRDRPRHECGRPATLLAGLDHLMPCTVLVDEADALARYGHGFDRDFFRSLPDPLPGSPIDLGLCLTFRSGETVCDQRPDIALSQRFGEGACGQLDSTAADALVSVLGQRLAPVRARRLAGSQWVCSGWPCLLAGRRPGADDRPLRQRHAGGIRSVVG